MAEEQFSTILSDEKPGNLRNIGNVYLPVAIELARTRMRIKDVLELDKGSIIEFDKLAGETVDLIINDKKFAEGEVVVIDEHFGIRITNLVSEQDFVRELEGSR